MMKIYETRWSSGDPDGDSYGIKGFLRENLEFESFNEYFDFSKKYCLTVLLGGFLSCFRPISISYNDIREVIVTDKDVTFKLGRAASLVLSSGEGRYVLLIKKEDKDD